jgi:hypothetical protein
VDYEPPDKDGHVYISKGVLQLADTEAVEAHLPGADLLTLAGCVPVLATLAEKRLDALCAAVQWNPDAPPPDARAWLGLAHNEGLHAAVVSCVRHKGVWEAFCTTNRRVKTDKFDGDKAIRYGTICITGGPYWDRVAAALADASVAPVEDFDDPGLHDLLDPDEEEYGEPLPATGT